MSRVPELPPSCAPLIVVALLAKSLAVYLVVTSEYASFVLVVVAFFVSGFLADLITAFAHFALDYVVTSYKIPVIGPMAREFQKHHENPVQYPTNSNYSVNFTKGAYGNLPVLIPVIVIAWNGIEGVLSFFILTTLVGASVWAFFVNQIHAYTHIGADCFSEELQQQMERIKDLASETEQRKKYETLFETVPIPWAIRTLQNLRLILSPSAHNVHHITFEKNFAIINGWSNPVANLILQPLARQFKAKA